MKDVAEDYRYTFRMEPLHGSEARLSSLRHICSASSTCMCMVIIPYDTFLFVENFQNPTHAFSQKHFKSGFTAKPALLFTNTLISQYGLANQILQQSMPATVDSPQGYDSQPTHKKLRILFSPNPSLARTQPSYNSPLFCKDPTNGS